MMILILIVLEHFVKVDLLKIETKAIDKKRYEELKRDEIKRLMKNREAHGIPEYFYYRQDDMVVVRGERVCVDSLFLILDLLRGEA